MVSLTDIKKNKSKLLEVANPNEGVIVIILSIELLQLENQTFLRNAFIIPNKVTIVTFKVFILYNST